QLSTWIFRVATNVSLTRSKQRRRRRPAVALEAVSEPAAREAPGGLETLEAEERREAVRRAVRELPEEQRAVAVLRGLEGFSFEEVARILGIKRPTAESRM